MVEIKNMLEKIGSKSQTDNPQLQSIQPPYQPDPNESFIKNRFSDYYTKHRIMPPLKIATREFGFGTWVKKIGARHFSFANDKELQGYLARNAPFFISYSAAEYKYPTARPIERKIMTGGELVFDIDSNELDVNCISKHGKAFVCEKCMKAAKDAVSRLINDFLLSDFNVNPSNISVNWSGNRGYHIHVEEEFNELGGYARREIADYVNGKGIEYDNIFKDKGPKVIGPKPSDGGWKGRIARTVVERIRNADLESLGIHPRTAKKFYDANASKYIEDGNWERVYMSKKKEFYSDLISTIAKMHACHVDEQVTMDISRLIRLPDTLHGETGMIAKRIKLNEFDKFDPFRGPLVFGNTPLRVLIKKCHELRIGDQTFGPFNEEKKELPEFAAIYLICKKVASIAE